MNRVYKYGCLAPATNASLVHDQMRAAHRYRNQLVEIERARRAAMRVEGADKSLVNALAADLRRGARALTPCYWGTYLLIEGSDDQARKAAFDPHFQRWEGDGAVGVQIQGGMYAHEMDADTRVRLTSPNEKRHAVLSIRASSLGRAPVWAEFPIFLHRPIPAGAIVKYVTVHMRRRGRKSVWTAEFSLILPAALRTCGQGAVGVDLGWRMIKGEERVCTYASEDGKDEGDLRLTACELGGFDRVETLSSTRDSKLNALKGVIAVYRTRADASDFFRERTMHVHAWRSPGRFVELLLEYRRTSVRSPFDSEVVQTLMEFRHRDAHLWDWQENQRKRNLEHRKKKYEVFAAKLASKYETLVLEDFDLRAFAKRPEKDAPRDEAGRRESHQAEKARGQRHEAATSILRSVLMNAFERRGGAIVKVPAMDTTRTCFECGLIVDRDFAASVDWTCDCGAVHDQDVNAADNLCERWRALESGGGARDSKISKSLAKKEPKWARLKREKLEKDAAREAI